VCVRERETASVVGIGRLCMHHVYVCAYILYVCIRTYAYPICKYMNVDRTVELFVHVHTYMHLYKCMYIERGADGGMGWLRLVGALKL